MKMKTGFSFLILQSVLQLVALGANTVPYDTWIEIYEEDNYSPNMLNRVVDMNEEWVVVGQPDYGVNGRVGVYSRPLLSSRFGDATYYLTAPGPVYGNAFGSSVQLDGNRLIIGDPSSRIAAGSAFIFEYDAALTNWQFKVELIPSDSATSENFGGAVSLSGNYACIGSFVSGKAYIYRLNGGVWQEDIWFNPGGNSPSVTTERGFDDTFFIGQPRHGNLQKGRVKLYVSLGIENWINYQTLKPEDLKETDYFGSSMACDGETLLIGAPGETSAGVMPGSVYVYDRESRTNWMLQAKLTASDAGALDGFGHSVSVNGNVAVIGAPRWDLPAYEDTGSTYIFLRDASGSWHEMGLRAEVISYDNGAFGKAVSVVSNSVLIAHQGVYNPSLSQHVLASLTHLQLDDVDMDGLADVFETDTGIYVSGSNTGSSSADPDSDQDLLLDSDELLLGLDPNDGDSAFLLAALVQTNAATLTLRWPSQEGLSFNLRGTNDLTVDYTNWPVLVERIPAVTGDFTEYPVGFSETGMFYRVELRRY